MKITDANKEIVVELDASFKETMRQFTIIRWMLIVFFAEALIAVLLPLLKAFH